ncbi:MAG: ABC transporter substrate-binding protein, partial [Chloroflexota bacterium]
FIIDKETIGDRGKTAIGTGPFKVDSFVPNSHIELSAFKDYWEKGKPYLDKYSIKQVPDKSALTINLESGALDCISQTPLVDYVRLDKSDAFVGEKGYVSGQFDISVNTRVEPLNNKKVRQAIAWSIDRARFCRMVMQGLTEPNCLMWPAHSWAYFKDLAGSIDYDLAKAKALLEEAGYGGGFATEILADTGQQGGRELAEMLAADLKKIGIDAKIAAVEHASYQNRYITKKEFQLATHSYGRAGRDPGTLVTGAVVWYTDNREGCPSGFVSEAWDRLRDELQSTFDREKRLPVCRKLQEMALDECFTLPVTGSLSPIVRANYVKNFALDLQNSPWVGYVWLDK